MRKLRPVLAAVTAILFYAITDILIWQRIFETHQMTQFADTYHTGWFVTLAGYALIGTLLMWGSWKDCVYFLIAVFVGAFSGLEDVLYYVLDMKPVPTSLPWLSGNPMIYGHTRLEVVGSVLFWMLFLVIVYLVLYVWLKNLRFRPAKIKIQPEETPIVRTLAEVDKV